MTTKITGTTLAVTSTLFVLGLAGDVRAQVPVNDGVVLVNRSIVRGSRILEDASALVEDAHFITIQGPAGQPLVWSVPQDFIFYNPNTSTTCPASVAAGSFAGCTDVARVVNNSITGQAEIWFASDDDDGGTTSFNELPGGAVPVGGNQPLSELGMGLGFWSPFLALTDPVTGAVYQGRVKMFSDINESTFVSVSDTGIVQAQVPALPPWGVAGLAACLLGMGGLLVRRRLSGQDLAR